MTKDEQIRRYDYLISRIEDTKDSLNEYNLRSTYTNKYFSTANVNYLPMETFDQKTALIINRLNQVRKDLESYKNELDHMLQKAKAQSDWYKR